MTSTAPATGESAPADLAWRRIIEQFRQPSAPRALWQLVNTFVPYLLLWALVPLVQSISIWLVLPLAVVAGAFLVRIFIILHDCGHGSYFKSARANALLGFVAGVLTFTSYYHWRWEHAIHHGSAGNLDRRGTGDIWTMTVQEYLESSRLKRFAYRLARNPLVLFLLAPLFMFVVMQRFPKPESGARERWCVWRTNVAIAGLALVLCGIFGVGTYLLFQLVTLAVAGAAGIWLFYVQHQYEDVYWARGEEWDYAAAALQGSSYYQLPAILQWFSGNIGFHHIHHLSARIPNYNLQKCHEADPLFQAIKPLTLSGSLKALSLRLWDERSRKLVGFAELRRMSGQGQRASSP